jgi:hypothetical protein
MRLIQWCWFLATYALMDFIALPSARVSSQYPRQRTVRGLAEGPAVTKQLSADRTKERFGAIGCAEYIRGGGSS